jgi:hypothetical protein
LATFLYSPGIKIIVATASNGVIDVSDDISDGTISLNENQSHTINFNLVNHRRKYDGVFTPNDRFTVQLKRVRWLRIMSGYLSQVPFFTTYPKSVALSGECTLKRLRYRLWDPGYVKTVELLNDYTSNDNQEGRALDDSFKAKAIAVLTQVAQWEEETIHIARLPDAWLNRVDTLSRELSADFAIAAELLGSGASMNGVDPLAEAGTRTLKKTNEQGDSVPDTGPGYGSLPYTSGKVVEGTNRSGTASLTGENMAAPADQWWCDIRLPYEGTHHPGGWGINAGNFNQPGQTYSPEEKAAARAWWANKRLVVVNPNTNQSVVVRVINHGPPVGSGNIVVSRATLERIGAANGQDVKILFAKDQAATLGSDAVVVEDTAAPSSTPQTGFNAGFGTPATPVIAGAVVNEDNEPLKGTKAGLAPHVAKAMDFVWQNFPGVLSIGGVGQRGNKSDHPRGYALDFMVESGGTRATGEALANGNAIAAWFASNPNAFGTKYIIWQARSNSGKGWHEYRHPSGRTDNTALHYDHVHVSFTDAAGNGEMGGTWPGSAPGDFAGGMSTSSVGGPMLVNGSFDFGNADPTSSQYVGIRALMNDVPIMPYITTMMQTSMRSYCSAPNGDFIGWFPDYFGVYGTAARMFVRDIELEDFSMVWTDEGLITHAFATASLSGAGSPGMQTEIEALRLSTYGIASVEFPSILKALLNVDPADSALAGWLSPEAILDRFGARVMKADMGALTNHKAEFWYALQLFQENWSNQFRASVPLSFMPELFPGMLLVLEGFGIQFYVQAVTHTFNLESGGFSTDVSVKAPSSINGKGLYGIAKGGAL